jgi:hypothetical protein
MAGDDSTLTVDSIGDLSDKLFDFTSKIDAELSNRLDSLVVHDMRMMRMQCSNTLKLFMENVTNK